MAETTPGKILTELDLILTASTNLASRVTTLESVSDSNRLTVGQEIITRMAANSVAAVGLNSQSLRLAFFTARKTETSSQIRFISGSTAAGATPTIVRFGLFSLDASNNGTLIASTPNDTALLAASNTVYTKSWSVPRAIVAGTRYALGALVVTGATAPNLAGWAFGPFPTELAVAPRMTAQITSMADMPASFLASSFSASALSGIPYVVLLP